MSVKIVTVKCSECSGALNIESDRTQAFCSYCGAKILINNENEYVYRHIDEAGIKQAETEQLIRLKELELAEREMLSKQKIKKLKIIISIILASIGILLMIIGFLAGSASGDPDSGFYALALIGFFPLMAPGFILSISSDDEKQKEKAKKKKKK